MHALTLPHHHRVRDPTLFEDAQHNIHLVFHGYQWQGLWTGMHAYSTDGNVFSLSQRRDGRAAFSTNQTYLLTRDKSSPYLQLCIFQNDSMWL